MKYQKYHLETIDTLVKEPEHFADCYFFEKCLDNPSGSEIVEIEDLDNLDTNTVINRIQCDVFRFKDSSGVNMINITAYVPVEEEEV